LAGDTKFGDGHYRAAAGAHRECLSCRPSISRVDVCGHYFWNSHAQSGADRSIFRPAFIRDPSALQLCVPCWTDELHIRDRRRDMGVVWLGCPARTCMADTVRIIFAFCRSPVFLPSLGTWHLRDRFAFSRTFAAVGATGRTPASQHRRFFVQRRTVSDRCATAVRQSDHATLSSPRRGSNAASSTG